MTRFLLVVTLFIWTLHAYGKKRESYFVFDSSLHLAQPTNYNTVKLLDNRLNKSLIVGNTFYSLPYDILMLPSPPEAINTFGNQLCNHPHSKEKTLLIVFNGQYLFTDKSMTIFQISANFFIGENNAFKYLFTADTLIEDYTPPSTFKGTKNKIPYWSTIINDTWLQCFKKAAVIQPSLDSNIYDEISATNRYENLKQKIPVYIEKNYPIGVYKTREEFLNLTPSIREFKRWDFSDGTVDRFAFDNKGSNSTEKTDGKSYYAVWTGKRWYKSAYPHPTQMHLKNGDFYFDILLSGLKYQEAPLLTMGAAGYLANEVTNSSIRDKRKLVSRKYTVRLDAETGKYIRVSRLDSY